MGGSIRKNWHIAGVKKKLMSSVKSIDTRRRGAGHTPRDCYGLSQVDSISWCMIRTASSGLFLVKKSEAVSLYPIFVHRYSFFLKYKKLI